ncbi:MAG: hypothetical protein JRD93_15685 [Deltaproteobacteria bacterium]|nr:hypothetical protein [Deltaproteobacteria bacterium]
MDITLSIACADLSADDLQELTRALSRTLNEETELTASLPEEPSRNAGTRGDLITPAYILLTALSSGTIVALFNVMKSYFERRSALEMVCERKDGEKFVIRAENLKANQVNETIKLANEFLRG